MRLLFENLAKKHFTRERLDWEFRQSKRELEEIKKCVLAIAWIPLEKVIGITYGNFDSPELDRFFEEMNLNKKGVRVIHI